MQWPAKIHTYKIQYTTQNNTKIPVHTVHAVNTNITPKSNRLLGKQGAQSAQILYCKVIQENNTSYFY